MNLIFDHLNFCLWIILWGAVILNALILVDWFQLKYTRYEDRKLIIGARNKPQGTLDSFKLYYEEWK